MLDKEHWSECTPRLMLPYGRWDCDGYSVLFNRKYWPLVARIQNTTLLADPGWWVPFKQQTFLFNDGSNPSYVTPDRRYQSRQRAALERCNAALAAWDLPTLPKEALRSRPTTQALQYDQMEWQGGMLRQDLEKRHAPWKFWFPYETELFRGTVLT